MRQVVFDFDYEPENVEREIQIVVERDRTVTPRPYQNEAADSVYREWKQGNKTMVVMATGTGKSVLFSEVMRRWKEMAA